jgi:hypothetical protein
MRIIGGFIRLVCGLVVMGTALHSYLISKDSTGSPALFGRDLPVGREALQWLIIGSGAVGLYIALGGLIALLSKPKPAPAKPQ